MRQRTRSPFNITPGNGPRAYLTPDSIPVRAAAAGDSRDETAHAPAEAAQTYLALAQGTHGVAARGHPGLHALDQRLVLHADAPVDAPVEITRGAHFAPRIRVHIGDLPDHRLGRRHGQELHEIDLVRIDIESDIRPQLEIDPQPLPLVRQVIDPRQQPLIEPLGQLARGLSAQQRPTSCRSRACASMP